jgi:Ca2+-binding RTX toxin-like protein
MSTTTVNFPTGKSSSLPIAVDNTPLARATADALAAKLHAEFKAGILTSYTVNPDDVVNPPTGNGLMIVNTADGLAIPVGTTEVLVENNISAELIASPGAGNVDVVSGTGGLTYFANDATGTVLAAGGNNVIQTLETGGGNQTIITGAGDDVIDAFSGNNFIAAGTGTNNVTLGTGNNNVVSTGVDSFRIDSSATVGGNDTISAATNSNADTIIGGLNNVTFINGSGASQLFGGSGSDTVFSGTGGGSYQGGSAGDNVLIAGSGQTTLMGGGNGDVLSLTLGHKADLLQAGAGNETLIGGLSTGANTFQAGSGSDFILGGLGNDTIQGGTGAAMEYGSFGNNTFLFVDGQAGGSDTIGDFSLSSSNKIALQGYGADAVANALASATVSHGSTTLTLSDNTSITLTGVTHLHASNFT